MPIHMSMHMSMHMSTCLHTRTQMSIHMSPHMSTHMSPASLRAAMASHGRHLGACRWRTHVYTHVYTQVYAHVFSHVHYAGRPSRALPSTTSPERQLFVFRDPNPMPCFFVFFDCRPRIHPRPMLSSQHNPSASAVGVLRGVFGLQKRGQALAGGLRQGSRVAHTSLSTSQTHAARVPGSYPKQSCQFKSYDPLSSYDPFGVYGRWMGSGYRSSQDLYIYSTAVARTYIYSTAVARFWRTSEERCTRCRVAYPTLLAALRPLNKTE